MIGSERTNAPAEVSSTHSTLISVKNLSVTYTLKRSIFGRPLQTLKGVDGISFDINEGETLGLVGESGCGKTTIGKTLLNLTPKTSGEVIFNGNVHLDKLSHRELRDFRPKIQIIFQDPYASLSPRLPVGEIIGEAVREHHIVPDNELDAPSPRADQSECCSCKV